MPSKDVIGPGMSPRAAEACASGACPSKTLPNGDVGASWGVSSPRGTRTCRPAATGLMSRKDGIRSGTALWKVEADAGAFDLAFAGPRTTLTTSTARPRAGSSRKSLPILPLPSEYWR
jgi:hypothetical protein